MAASALGDLVAQWHAGVSSCKAIGTRLIFHPSSARRMARRIIAPKSSASR